MCYTIEINLTREQIEKRFKAQFDTNSTYKRGRVVSAFSLPKVPVICSDTPFNIETPIWGLIPSWVKNHEQAASVRTKTLNAKAETIFDKPSFRQSAGKKHCIIICSGFYEWQHRGKQKVPYYITSSDDELLPLAGIFDDWTDEQTGELIRTFSVVTTKANRLMETIHNTKKRMPLMLPKGNETDWHNLNTSRLVEEFIDKKGQAGHIKAIEADKSLFIKPSTDGQQRLF